MSNRKYNSEHINFLKENIKGTSFKKLTKMFNEHYGMSLNMGAIVSLTHRHGLHNGRDTRLDKGHKPTQFKKGHKPWNKGKKGINIGGKAAQFKKGNIPANRVPIGTERITKDGYIKIKIQDGKLNDNWKMKHVLVWEETHGAVPEGHTVVFGDSNRQNCKLENLVLVSKAQLVRMNQMGLIQNDARLTKTGALIADIYNKIGEAKRRKSHGNTK